eukprot:TsM_000348000 transcript=TsM_000348000 gene=TsM_000348000
MALHRRPSDSNVPDNAQPVVVNPYVVRLMWDPPPRPQGSFVGYLVSWYPDSGYHRDSPASENRNSALQTQIQNKSFLPSLVQSFKLMAQMGPKTLVKLVRSKRQYTSYE